MDSAVSALFVVEYKLTQEEIQVNLCLRLSFSECQLLP